MAVPPAPGAVSATDVSEGPRPTRLRPTRVRLVLLVVLLAALVASSCALVWVLTTRDGESDGAQQEREQVMSQTRQFVLRLNTYGPDDLDEEKRLRDYQAQVTEVITPKFAADFESSGLPIAEQTVARAGYSRSAEVFGVGVQRLDEDSAVAIVAAGLTGSRPDPKAPDDASKRGAAEDVLRWEGDLVKVDGEWLVDDYAPVTGEGS